MESKIAAIRFPGGRVLAGALGVSLLIPISGIGQDKAATQEPAQITMRKFAKTRQFQGREIQGEERVVGPGDSLWRLLVGEKRVPERKFQDYVALIRDLNPQLKSVDILRVGERIFLPQDPHDVVPSPAGTARELPPPPAARPRLAPGSYRVKAGDQLFQILREQLRIQDNIELAEYFAMVKELNPDKKNWDLLRVGEIIRLPTVEKAPGNVAVEAKVESRPKVTSLPVALPPKEEAKASMPTLDHDPRRLPARENLELLASILEALGCELQRSGEEVIALKDGTIRIDRSLYPIAYNPKLRQKLVIDPEDNIPLTLRARLNDPNVATPVLPIPRGTSVQDAVSRLLAGMGYQVLPSGRPVIIQDDGVVFEANGSWMVLPPEESNKPQEIYAINLTARPREIPEYLRTRLEAKGLYWKNVSLPQLVGGDGAAAALAKNENFFMQVRMWPRDKQAVVDALLFTYGIPFGVAETLSINLRDGLRVDAKSDRIFQLRGQRTAIFFHRAEPEVKKILQEKEGMKTIELEVASLSSREIIGKLLNELGEKVAYKEHRFQAAPGSVGEGLMVTTSGFLASQRSLFVTDREIPVSLRRFFFERGWEIVYFE